MIVYCVFSEVQRLTRVRRLFWGLIGVVRHSFFFFSSRRRHTRFKCDWSSDVCSSDLDTCADASGAPQDLPATPARAPGSAARAPGSAAEETFAAAAAAFMAGRDAQVRRGGREAGGGRGWMSVGAVSF